MQSRASVCKENVIRTIIRKRKRRLFNNFVVKGASLKDNIGRVREGIKMIFSRMIHYSIKVLVLQ